MPGAHTASLYLNGTATNELINNNITSKGFVAKYSSAIADIFMVSGTDLLYVIRINPTDKTITSMNDISSRIAWKSFNNTDILTQIDALDQGSYAGFLSGTNSSGSTMPTTNTSWYVDVRKNSANYVTVRIETASGTLKRYIKHKENGTWGGTWTEI